MYMNMYIQCIYTDWLGWLVTVLRDFREIFRILDLMKMDMANFTIQQLRPLIQQQSVNYEQQKFDTFLKQQKGVCVPLETSQTFCKIFLHLNTGHFLSSRRVRVSSESTHTLWKIFPHLNAGCCISINFWLKKSSIGHIE